MVRYSSPLSAPPPSQRLLSPVVFNARQESIHPVPNRPPAPWVRVVFVAAALASLGVLVLYAVKDIKADATLDVGLARRGGENATAQVASTPEVIPASAPVRHDEYVPPVQEGEEEEEEEEEAEDIDEAGEADDYPTLEKLSLRDVENEASIRTRFAQSASHFSSSVEAVDETVFALMDAAARLRRDRRVVQAELTEQDKALSEALTHGDFAAAQRAQLGLDAGHARLSALSTQLETNRISLSNAEAERAQMHSKEIAEVEHLAQMLQLNAEALGSRIALATRVADTELASQRRASEERAQELERSLQGKKGECIAAQGNLDQIAAKIAQATKDLTASQHGVQSEIEAIDLDIALLEKKLKDKREERQAARGRLIKIEEDIVSVASRFSPRRDQAESALETCESEAESLAEQREAVDRALAALIARNAETAAAIEQESLRLARVKLDMDILAQVRSSLQQALTPNVPSALSTRLAALREVVAEKQGAVDRFALDIADLQAEAKAKVLEQSCSASADPAVLESQMQLALNAHAFDEASRLAEEIRQLPALRERTLAEVRAISAALQSKTVASRAVESELAEATRELDTLVRETDQVKMRNAELLIETLAKLDISGGVDDNLVLRAALDVVKTEKRTLERRLVKLRGLVDEEARS